MSVHHDPHAVDVRTAIKTVQVHTFLLSDAIENNKMTSVHRMGERATLETEKQEKKMPLPNEKRKKKSHSQTY